MSFKLRSGSESLNSHSGLKFKELGSSPAKQVITPKPTIEWGPEEQTGKYVEPNDRGGHTTKTTFQTEGSSYTPPNKTKEGDLAYANMTPQQRKIQDDNYIAKNTQKVAKSRQELEETKNNMEGIPKLPAKTIPVELTENLQQPKMKKFTKVVDEKPGLFNRGRVTVTNNETGKSHSSKTSSRTGEVAKKVGKFVKNIIPTQGFKRRDMPNRKNGSTDCTI